MDQEPQPSIHLHPVSLLLRQAHQWVQGDHQELVEEHQEIDSWTLVCFCKLCFKIISGLQLLLQPGHQNRPRCEGVEGIEVGEEVGVGGGQ